MAAESVLTLPELLTNILLNLSFQDVMRARGVNHIWQDVIDTSPEILWNTWRSPIPPKSARKHRLTDPSSPQLPPQPLDFEPFKPFFEKTLINTDEWITGISPSEPPPRIAQRQFIRRSLQEFIAKHAANLKRFYITRPPLKKIDSSIKLITAGRSSLQTSFDRGFFVDCSPADAGITVDMYLRALLACLDASWGHINLPPTLDSSNNMATVSTTITAGASTNTNTNSITSYARVGIGNEEYWGVSSPDMVVRRRKHRLETQLLTMKTEHFDDDGPRMTRLEEWENGAMSSTLIIKVQVSESSMVLRPQKKSWFATLYDALFGAWSR
ncbi:hypothetical protein Dda_2558 [Drechslerella dactyloides]|uniref:F-box domain-containing protein n=1 Tax=Drechslerella dactyloides TaxID=74499 RepID=A0AAD6NKF1_DREDA|nr:hypothetical protein Dda_2558 [Drechslerella dactyloides]